VFRFEPTPGFLSQLPLTTTSALQTYIYNVTVNMLLPSGSTWTEIPLEVRGEAIVNVVDYSQKGASYTKEATKKLQENLKNRKKSKTRPWELERAGGSTNAGPNAKPAEKVARVVEMPEDIIVGCVGEAVEAEPQPDSALKIQDKGDTRALAVSGQEDSRNDGQSERDQLPESGGQAVGNTQDLLEGTSDKILEQNTAEFVYRAGAKVIALAEHDGGIIYENGLDIEELRAYHQRHGTITGFPGANTVRGLLQQRSASRLPPDPFFLLPGIV
jgi:hypothetical protein